VGKRVIASDDILLELHAIWFSDVSLNKGTVTENLDIEVATHHFS
jgi:hypothetical protein